MKKAIFWDLQGTLGGQATADINEFQFYSFSFEALKIAFNAGYLNIIITNQSKIGKGVFSMADYEAKISVLTAQAKKNGAEIHKFMCCPHTKFDNCKCKKPKTGLINIAVDEYNIDLNNSFVIGDMGKNEIVMAKNAGVKGILVMTGGGIDSLNKFRDTWKECEADYIAENALKAVEWIISFQ